MKNEDLLLLGLLAVVTAVIAAKKFWPRQQRVMNTAPTLLQTASNPLPAKSVYRVYHDAIEDKARDLAAEKIAAAHADYQAQQLATAHGAALAPLANPSPAPNGTPS